MIETAFYILSSFWLGAAHAATPGHGKTITAAYLVGARGRPVDALVLGLVVTLSHTGGIVLFGLLATLGSSAILTGQAEGYLSLATSLLVVGLGLWMLWSRRGLLPFGRRGYGSPPSSATVSAGGAAHSHDAYAHDHEGVHHHRDAEGEHHHHAHHGHHRHGWRYHLQQHPMDLDARRRPSLGLLFGLGVAGGALPDPAALAVLLSAVANGRLVLGLMTVLVFSVGFASVLVVVGLAAARVGRAILDEIGEGRSADRLEVATSILIVCVGVVLSAGALQTLGLLR